MIIYHARSPWHENVVHLKGFEPWSSVRRANLCHSEISLQKGWILRWLEIQYWTTQFFEPPMVKLIWFELSWGRVLKNEGSRKLKFYLIYRKIPKISPRDYIFQRPFLRDKLKQGADIHQPTAGPVPLACKQPYHLRSGSHGQLFHPYIWREICVSKSARLTLGGKFESQKRLG